MKLKLVPDEEPEALSLPELKEHGDRLLRVAIGHAGTALMASVRPEFLFKRTSYGFRDVERIRDMAREASEAWALVADCMGDLMSEVDRSKDASRRKP